MEAIMLTARDLADQVVAARRNEWEQLDPTVAIVATEQLNPDDQRVVSRIVEGAGYKGVQLEEMILRVSSLFVGQVEALNDNMPTVGG